MFSLFFILFVLQCWSHPAQKGGETSGVSCTLSGAASHATADERSREPRQPRGAQRKAVPPKACLDHLGNQEFGSEL